MFFKIKKSVLSHQVKTDLKTKLLDKWVLEPIVALTNLYLQSFLNLTFKTIDICFIRTGYQQY